MALTILAIPLIFLGAFINPYSLESTRCFTISFVSKGVYCFEQGSSIPELIKYGCVLAGFALLYAGRRQIKRQRDQN
ncbi:MAG TPA: hypothetical protein VII80_06215 [Pseudolabrys sp.]|jgi:hypothetical protein